MEQFGQHMAISKVPVLIFSCTKPISNKKKLFSSYPSAMMTCCLLSNTSDASILCFFLEEPQFLCGAGSLHSIVAKLDKTFSGKRAKAGKRWYFCLGKVDLVQYQPF